MRKLAIAALAALIVIMTAPMVQAKTAAENAVTTGTVGEVNGQRVVFVVVKSGDRVWTLCMKRDWCRFYYEKKLNKNAADFEKRVAALNPGKDINVIKPGDTLALPMMPGVAKELDAAASYVHHLERLLADLRHQLTETLRKVVNLESVIAGLKEAVTRLTAALATKERENIDLTAKIDEEKTKVSNSERAYADLAESNTDLYRNNQALTRENDDLTKRLAESEDRVGELEDITRSQLSTMREQSESIRELKELKGVETLPHNGRIELKSRPPRG